MQEVDSLPLLYWTFPQVSSLLDKALDFLLPSGLGWGCYLLQTFPPCIHKSGRSSSLASSLLFLPGSCVVCFPFFFAAGLWPHMWPVSLDVLLHYMLYLNRFQVFRCRGWITFLYNRDIDAQQTVGCVPPLSFTELTWPFSQEILVDARSQSHLLQAFSPALVYS